MSDVIAPKDGYISKEKQQYREDVWGNVAPYITQKLRDNANNKVLIMPSKEGKEIAVALEHGIKQESIICVDKNPAEIATSKWRKEYPRVKFFGCEVAKVGDKIKKKGWRIVFANLDFCYNFSHHLINEITFFLQTCPLLHDGLISVTLMKGREATEIPIILEKLDKTKVKFTSNRLKALTSVLDTKVVFDKNPFFEGYYKSTSPMIYGCFRIKPTDLNPHDYDYDTHQKIIGQCFVTYYFNEERLKDNDGVEYIKVHDADTGEEKHNCYGESFIDFLLECIGFPIEEVHQYLSNFDDNYVRQWSKQVFDKFINYYLEEGFLKVRYTPKKKIPVTDCINKEIIENICNIAIKERQDGENEFYKKNRAFFGYVGRAPTTDDLLHGYWKEVMRKLGRR